MTTPSPSPTGYFKPIKTSALKALKSEKYQTDTLILQLDLDASHSLTATVSYYALQANNTASKKRTRQVMAVLDQQQPGDILHKGLVAEMLVPFVHIGKASHLKNTEPVGPCTSRAYGIIAHCVLQSIKLLPNSTATGFYTKTGMAALKVENFELPNEGWSLSWDGSGNMVPCMFGIRVLEKIQKVEPAVVAPLDEEDQEDLEAGLEQEMVDEEIREYAAVKAAIKQSLDVEESIDDEFITIEMDLELFGADAPPSAMAEPSQEKEVLIPPPQVETAEEPLAQQYVPQVAGQKPPREGTNELECNERIKKSKPTPKPLPGQVAGVERPHADNEPSEDAIKKPQSAPAAQVPKKVTLAGILPKTAHWTPGPDTAAVASVEQHTTEKPQRPLNEKPRPKAKAAAKEFQLPTPQESTGSEASAPTAARIAPLPPPQGPPALPSLAPSGPMRPPLLRREPIPLTRPSAGPSAPPADPFTAPRTTPVSPLDFKATALYHNTTLSTLHVPELRALLKEWNYKSPKGSTILSRMNKPELVRVVQEAIQARDEQKVLAGR